MYVTDRLADRQRNGKMGEGTGKGRGKEKGRRKREEMKRRRVKKRVLRKFDQGMARRRDRLAYGLSAFCLLIGLERRIEW